jgi:hypothetical protein
MRRILDARSIKLVISCHAPDSCGLVLLEPFVSSGEDQRDARVAECAPGSALS